MRLRIAGLLLVVPLLALVPPAVATAATATGSGFVGITPTRLLDTRHARAVPANGTFVLRVTGVAGVPANASAVALTVTATDATGAGYVSVFPHGMARPDTSTQNFTPAGPISGSTFVPPGTGGEVDMFVHGAAADLIVDVTGYFDPTVQGDFQSFPVRVLDTRIGLGTDPGGVFRGTGPVGPIPPGGSLDLDLSNNGAIRFGNLSAAIMTVTVTQPASSGYVTVYPDNQPRPGTSTVNFMRGQTVANMIATGTGTGVEIYNGSSGATQVIVDVEGYFDPDGGESYVPVAQYRAVQPVLPAMSGATVAVPQPAGGMPGADILAMTATATDTTGHGYLTVNGDSGTSDVDWTENTTVADLTMPGISSTSDIGIRNLSSGGVQVLGDVLGYFMSPPQP